MKKSLISIYLLILLMTFSKISFSQSVKDKLLLAMGQFESDSLLKHATVSLYVIKASTGEVVFDKNSMMGLAPASTQKVITSATAYELLGKEYVYKTYIGYDGKNGKLFFLGNGDPSFGSFRWPSTKDSAIYSRIFEVLRANKIKNIKNGILIDDMNFGINPMPDGWIWADMGNYYGAGTWGFNWMENQYDLILTAGKSIGEKTKLVKTVPALIDFQFSNYILTGPPGSGDQSIIYTAPYSVNAFATGTIPLGVIDFKVAGSMPFPAKQFGQGLMKFLLKRKLLVGATITTSSDLYLKNKSFDRKYRIIDSILSPPMDSLQYWFLQKSINFYGETFLKTVGSLQAKDDLFDAGIKRLRSFWAEKGIDPSELNIKDGSGLSPADRVTTHIEVEILKFARQRPWFPSFYAAIPENNKMKMKSGTIGDVKGFCGYHQSSDGNEYIFSFIVNNYDGPGITGKMYKVLDALK
jgi:serine-type D-Ala-D-Ala carboxypeptidase/endopeptidase (penicillin-binding protein 4)